MAAADFWNNQEAAQATVNERKALLTIVKPLDDALAASDDLDAMIEMAGEDESFAAEVPSEVSRLEEVIEQLKLQALLSGRHDAAGAILFHLRARRGNGCQRLGRDADADVHAMGTKERIQLLAHRPPR